MTTNKRSPTPEQINAEDPDTAAARKELRQTVISEKPNLSTMSATNPDEPAPKAKAISSHQKSTAQGATPDRESLEARNDDLKEQISSPKKKRAHAEVDAPMDATSDANGDVSPIGANGTTSLSRTNRSEPEKKRARDISSETKANDNAPNVSSESNKPFDPVGKRDEITRDMATEAKDDTSSEKEKKNTSASAFQSSGLSGFAAQASPFLQAGASAKPLSSFASATGSQLPFGGVAASTTSAFGGGGQSTSPFGAGTQAASPFGQIGSPKPFGTGVIGGGFGSSTAGSGASLTSFAKPGEAFKSSKPARPFGAPVSEDEDNDKDEDDTGNSTDNDRDKNEDKDADAEEDKSVGPEDKKKKLQRVAIDDGEAGEATILQARAKLYHLDKASSAWKERGAGNLKINVPLSCVETDKNTGAPIPGTFNSSSLDDAETKLVRLIMRQDSTHRVILNTVLIPAMEFKEKSTTKATCVLFTAIEDEGAVSIQIKMNAPNARSFLNEVGKIQRELQLV